MNAELKVEQIKKFTEYLQERENQPATIKKYQTDIAKFLGYCGDITIIDKAKVLEYKEWLISQYAISSVNSMLAALNQFFEFLGIEYLKVKKIKVQRNLFLQEEKELTKQEFQKLVEAARRKGKEWLALSMETIAGTGIRISELKFFTVENIKKGKIEVYNKGKYRRIFLPTIIRKKLLQFCKKMKIKSGYIFTTKDGKPQNRSYIWREMKKLKMETGIEETKIFPHNLRHLFARVYYEKTKDIAGLADLLGHSNVNVTRIYTSNTGEIYQKQLEKIDIIKSNNIISVM